MSINAISGTTTLTGTTTNAAAGKSGFEFIYGSGLLTLNAAPGAAIVLIGGTSTGAGNSIFNDYSGNTLYSVTGNVSFVAGVTSATDSFWGHQTSLTTGSPSFTVGANSALMLNAGVTSMTNALTVASMGANSSVTIAGSASGTMSGIMTLTNSSDSLNYAISGTLIQSGAINGVGAVTMTGSGAVTISGVIGGSNSVAMNGAGTLTLSGANTYTGPTTVSAGTMVLASSASLQTSGVNVTGGNLVVLGSFSGTPVSVSAGGTLSGTGSIGATTVAANGIVQAGVSGSGQLTLASLAFSGAGSVNFGTLASYLSFAGAGVQVSGALTPSASSNSVLINIASLAGTSAGSIYQLISYNGSIGGAGFGAFQLAPLPSRGTGILINNSGEIDLQITSTDFLIWTGAGNLAHGWDTTTQNWKLNSTGAPTAFINSPGDTVVFDDTASPSNTTVAVALNVTPSGVTFNNSVNNYTLQGSFAVGGVGGLTKSGTGSLTILTSNTYTGTTTLNGGIVNLGVAETGAPGGPLGIGGPIIFAGGTLQYSASNQFDYSGRFSTAYASQAYSVDTNGQNVTWAAALTSSGGTLYKTGAGILTLTGANTFGGGTTISQGTIQTNNASGVPGSATLGDANTGASNVSLLFNTGGTVTTSITVAAQGTGTATIGTYGGTFTTFTGSLTLGRNVTINDSTGDRSTFTGMISGPASGSINITITGHRVTFDYPFNSFVGNINIVTGSIFQLNNVNALPMTTSVTANGLFSLNTGNTPAIDALNGSGTVSIVASGAATLSLGNNNGSGTFSGVISNNTAVLSIATNGTGTEIFSGNNTYTGGTTINSGVLQVGAGGTTGALGSGAVTVNSPGTLIYNRSDASLTLSNISGSGSFTQAGSGTLILSSTVSYSGATTVASGTLLVNTNLSSSTVSVSGGATLGGTGSIGPTTVASNGIIQAGANGSGQLSIGGLTFNGTGSVNFGTLANYLSPSGAGVQVSGTLNPTGGSNSIQINVASVTGATTGSVYQLISYSGPIGGVGFGAFQLAALPGRTTGILVNNSGEIDLQITSNPFLIWTGTANLANGWDTTTKNWNLSSNGTPTAYINNPGDNVVFDDTAGSSKTTININSGNVTPGSVTFNNSVNNYTLQGANAIGGITGLTMNGTGQVTILTANFYTGVTALNGGIINVGVPQNGTTTGPLGASGTIFFAGGTLQYSASNQFDYSSRFSAAANQAYSVDTNGQNVTWAAVLGSTGGTLYKTGAGTLTLTGANTYDTGTTINAGTLQVGNGGVAGTLGTGPVVVNANGALVYNQTSVTVNNAISGAGVVSNTGTTGVLTISASISLTSGGFTFTSTGASAAVAPLGTLSTGANLSVGTGVGVIAVTNTNTAVGGYTGFAIAGTNSLSATGSGSITITGIANTTGGGANGLNLSGSNLTTSGTINLVGQNAGEWGIGFGSSVTINATSGTTTLTGTTTNAAAGKSGFEFIYGTGLLTLTANPGAAIVLIGGTSTGTGNSIFNDYSGNTLYSVTGNVSFVAGVTSSTDSFWGHQTSLTTGAPSFTVGDSSVLTLDAGVTSMTNALTVTALGNNSTVTIAGSATGTMSGAMALTNSTSLLAYTIAGTLTQSGAISGAGSVTMSGAGTLTLTGANSYTGPTTVTAGTLVIASSSTSQTSALNANGGTLLVNGSASNSPVSVSGGATLGGTGSVGATTVAANGIVQAGVGGSGQLTLANLAFSGPASVNFGALAGYSSATGIAITGALTTATSQSIQVNVSNVAGTTTGSTYKLIGYAGSIGGAGFGAFQLGSLPGRATGILVNNPGEIDLQITSTGFLIWTGAANLANGWDTTTKNWTLNAGGAATAYVNNYLTNPGDNVVFDDTAGAGTTTVNINSSNVTPSSVTFNNSVNNYTIQGNFVIGGPTGLAKTGTGALTILTANTYTGTTILNGGIVNLGVAQTGTTSGPLGASGLIVFGGGTLQYSANNQFDYSTRFSIGANQAYSVDTNGQSVTWAAPLTSSGGTLYKTGAGILTLTAANTFNGGTTISQGTIQTTNISGLPGSVTLGDAKTGANNVSLLFNTGGAVATSITVAAQGTGTVTIGTYGGTFTTFTGSLTLGRNVTINDSTGDRSTFTGVISGPTSGSINITISGHRVTFDNPANTFVGNLIIPIGSTFQENNVTALPITTSITANGTFSLNTGGSPAIDALNGSGGVSIIASGAANLAIGSSSSNSSGAFSGIVANSSATLSITKNGAGTEIFSGANSYTGGTTINGGTLSVSVDANLGAPTGTLSFGGGILQVTGTAYTSVPAARTLSWMAGGGGFDINNPANIFIVSQSLTDPGAPAPLVKLGAGTLVLSGTNTYTGGTTVSAGTLQFNSAAAIAGPVVVKLGATAAFAYAFGQSDLSTIDPSSAGVVALAASTNNNLDFTSSGAKLALVTLGATGAYTFSGTLTPNDTSNTYRLGGGGGRLIMGTSLADFSGTKLIIDGNGTTTGTVVLTMPSTYSGGTTILSGTLNVNSDSALGAAAGVVNLTGGTLQFAAGGGITLNSSRGIVLGGGAFDTNSGNDIINSVISGTNLIKVGAGDLVLTNTNTYTGSTTVNAGGLVVGNTASLGSGPLLVNNTNPAPSSTEVYLYNTGGQTVGTLSGQVAQAASGNTAGIFLSAGVTLTVNQTAPTTFQGTIFGSGSLVLGSSSTGTLTLSGNSTYAGSTTINGGTIQLGVSNALPATTALTLGSAGTLNINSNNQTIAALNSSAGNINTGTGTGGILTIGNTAGGTVTYNGVISGTGGLTWGIVNTNVANPTPSTLLLNNTSTNTGPMTINTGTLSIGTAYALSGGVAPTLPYSVAATYPGAFTLGPTATLLTNGFNLTVGSLGGGGPIGGNINLGNNSSSTLYIVQSSSTGYAGVISGTGNVYIVNGVNLAVYGNWTLTGGVTHDVTTLGANHNDSPQSYLPFATSGSAVTTQGIEFAGFTDQVSTIYGLASAR